MLTCRDQQAAAYKGSRRIFCHEKIFTIAVTATLCLLLLLATPSSVSFAENSCAESPVSSSSTSSSNESQPPLSDTIPGTDEIT